MFTPGSIHDVIVRDLTRHSDARGWLIEFFRIDEIAEPFHPVMSYVSTTNPGIARGPHEHADQADFFAFIGPSTFRVYLWDARKNSPTFGVHQVFEAGERQPRSVIVPAGVVHAYKNVGTGPGMVLNAPNRLFAGRGRKEPVDEIRHELDPNTIYRIE
jgi:dTDP-4-dehydrorhamnose 3,5-epimerase